MIWRLLLDLHPVPPQIRICILYFAMI
jgi:hypothetical protein